MTSNEQKIVELSAKVIAMQDTEAFEPAIRELRAAIHEHIEGARVKVAEMAFAIKNESDSKAAD